MPGPYPKAALAPRAGPDAIYSGLLECPLTSRVAKLHDSNDTRIPFGKGSHPNPDPDPDPSPDPNPNPNPTPNPNPNPDPNRKPHQAHGLLRGRGGGARAGGSFLNL